jgi:hypothetical protein
MGWQLMIQEIHACIGPKDFSGTPENPPVIGVAWNVDKIVRSFGINYNPDGTVQTPPTTPPPTP